MLMQLAISRLRNRGVTPQHFDRRAWRMLVSAEIASIKMLADEQTNGSMPQSIGGDVDLR